MGASAPLNLTREAVLLFLHSNIGNLDDRDLENIIDIWLSPAVYYAHITPEGADDLQLHGFSGAPK